MLKLLIVLALVPSDTPVANFQSQIHWPRAVYYRILRPGIAKEIELLDPQKADIKKLARVYRQETMAALADVNSRHPSVNPARTPEEQEMNRQNREAAAKARQPIERRWARALETVLLPDQIRRLNEIELQRLGGLDALVLREVQRALELSQKQVSQIEEFYSHRWDNIVATLHSGDYGAETPQAILQGELQKAKSYQQARSVLTPEQRQRFDELLGKPFDYDWSKPVGRK